MTVIIIKAMLAAKLYKYLFYETDFITNVFEIKLPKISLKLLTMNEVIVQPTRAFNLLFRA